MSIIHPLSLYPSLPMNRHRQLHPKPSTFNLIHKWKLNPDEIKLLDLYTLRIYPDYRLSDMLRSNHNQCVLNGDLYVPIYQNCTRHRLHYNHNYYVSYRKYKDFNVCIIQPART